MLLAFSVCVWGRGRLLDRPPGLATTNPEPYTPLIPPHPLPSTPLSLLQPKLSSLDAGGLARLMGSMAALKHEPEAAFMRAYCSEVYQKLPLFDDK